MDLEQSELLYLLKCMMRGFSAMFGSETELVLHDLEKREVVYIINGHITGREAGYRMDPSVYETMVALLQIHHPLPQVIAAIPQPGRRCAPVISLCGIRTIGREQWSV